MPLSSMASQQHVSAADGHFKNDERVGQAKADSKVRALGSTRNSKVTDAQKRIAKIIRDQGVGPQMTG